MDYKGYLIRGGKLIDKGSSREDTKGIKLNRVESIDKVWISRRRLSIIAALLVALYLGVTGQFGPPMDLLLSYGAFLLIAATLLSAFTTDRYAIKTSREKIEVPVKGSKGQEFLREIQSEAPVDVEHEDIGYGGSSDPFVGSTQEKKMNLMALGLIVIGSTLAIGVVAPMYSDNIDWDDMVPLVEVIQDDEAPESQIPSESSDYAAVYTSNNQATGEIFESEHATIEFSQHRSDLDGDGTQEIYLTAEFTRETEALRSIRVEIPSSQTYGDAEVPGTDYELGDAIEMPMSFYEAGDEWASYKVGVEGVQGSFGGYISTLNDEQWAMQPSNLQHRTLGGVTSETRLEEPSNKLIKGYYSPAIDMQSGEFKRDFDIKGFQPNDRIRIRGTISPPTVGSEDREVVLAEYTVK